MKRSYQALAMTGCVLLLAIGACAKQAPREQSSEVLDDSAQSVPLAQVAASTEAAPKLAACQSTGPDGERLSVQRKLTGQSVLEPPPQGAAPNISSSDVQYRFKSLGIFTESASSARCTELLLGLYTDSIAGPRGKLAWVLILSQYGVMGLPAGSPTPPQRFPVNYAQIQVIDAATGEMITSIESPTDELPPPPCPGGKANPCTKG